MAVYAAGNATVVGVPPPRRLVRCLRSPPERPAGSGDAVKPTVCLCMIVKNEAKVIERCLASVRDLVDTWVISDTGSTDGTQELIRATLQGIPGELHEEPWVNFGHNRSLNIRHARGKADYLLLLDADHVIRQDGPLPRLTAEAYMLRHESATEYRIKRLVRGDLPWRYEGVTHEYLTADRRDAQENLDALVIEDYADGGSRHDKFERDARLLSAEMERDPANGRTVFYLAQTMRDMGKADEAITLYERRAEMGAGARRCTTRCCRPGFSGRIPATGPRPWTPSPAPGSHARSGSKRVTN